MPVHAAGPRLYKSIKFAHLGKTAGGSRGSNVSMNLTPFVDMMTILVTFLLMVFSASGEILQQQKDLELPVAAQQAALQDAPIIVVTSQGVAVVIKDDRSAIPQMKDVATVQSLLDNPPAAMKIDSLHEVLKGAFDTIHNNVASEKGFSKEQLTACKREQDGLPALLRKDGSRIVCPDGLLIIQADKGTDARIINMVVNTARNAGFEKLLFAIKFEEGGAK